MKATKRCQTTKNNSEEKKMKFKKTMALLLAGAMALGNVTMAKAEENPVLVPTLYTMSTSGSGLTTSLTNTAIETVTVTAGSIKAAGFQTVLDLKQLNMSYQGKAIKTDVPAQQVNGKWLVPLRATLETLGYKVTWNAVLKSVDINRGAQFTTVYMGKNYYFKNKMAPIELSTAPVIINGRAMVPVEFLTEMLSIGAMVQDKVLVFDDYEDVTKTGYVYDITANDGSVDITLTTEKQTAATFNRDTTDYIIIHVLKDSSLVNKNDIAVGDMINVVVPPMMTMIFPPQTGAVVIY